MLKVVGIIILSTVLISIILKMIIYINTNTHSTYHTLNPEEYGNFEGHMDMEQEGRSSGLFIFPKEISSKAIDVDYFYLCGANTWENTYEIFLKVRYWKRN